MVPYIAIMLTGIAEGRVCPTSAKSFLPGTQVNIYPVPPPWLTSFYQASESHFFFRGIKRGLYEHEGTRCVSVSMSLCVHVCMRLFGLILSHVCKFEDTPL